MKDINVPHDLQMEKIALGAMLRYPSDLLIGCDLLSPTDFLLDSHRRIHRAMACMLVSYHSVDLATLSQWMKDEGTLDGVGGPAYLASLDEVMPIRGSVQQYAKTLRELSNRRALLSMTTIAVDLLQGGEDSEKTISTLETRIAELRAERTDNLISASEAVDRVGATLHGNNIRPAFSTGIFGLDAKTMGGIRPGELWTIGALPGRGKSSIARQIANRIALGGIPSLIFTLEMSVEEWWSVDQANEAGVEPWRLREPQYLTQGAREQVLSAGERIRDLPIWFEESSQIHVDKIVAKARLATLQKGVQFVVVDYVQRVLGNGKDMYTRIGDVTEKLAAFAKTNRVAVLLLSQLKRPDKINQRPTLEDLKESGYIGAHSHTVVLSYRPVDEDESFIGEDELIVAKQRFGPTGSIPVLFNGDTLRFDCRERTVGTSTLPRPQRVQEIRTAGMR